MPQTQFMTDRIRKIMLNTRPAMARPLAMVFISRTELIMPIMEVIKLNSGISHAAILTSPITKDRVALLVWIMYHNRGSGRISDRRIRLLIAIIKSGNLHSRGASLWRYSRILGLPHRRLLKIFLPQKIVYNLYSNIRIAIPDYEYDFAIDVKNAIIYAFFFME